MESLNTNYDIFIIVQSTKTNFKDYRKLSEIIISRLGTTLSENNVKILCECLRLFCKRLHGKWIQCSRNMKIFIKNQDIWLNRKFIWPKCVTETQILQMPRTSTNNAILYKAFRKPFSELSDKQKKRRAQDLRSKRCSEELLYTTKLSMKADGHPDITKIIDHLLKNPQDIPKVNDILFGFKKTTIPPDTALALTTSTKLSTWQYLTVRQQAIEEKSKIYPSYYQMQKAKERCYPPKDDILVTERMAKIKVQSILDITVKRILLVHQKELVNENITLISKWGFDGASGQSLYKQKFINSDNNNTDDSSISMSSFVPIKLFTSRNEIIWENPCPSSTHYCRPIKFEFIKETENTIRTELRELQNEIDNFLPTNCEKGVTVKHQMLMTMLDGKASTVISDTPSASTCNICLAKPSEMNNLQMIYKKQQRKDIYKFGLSTLHMWIRCFECLLHISYNLDFKKWMAKGDDRLLKQTRKEKIQNDFRREFGLLIDIVKQGVGTTNDGNTARQFFKNYVKSAAITGLNQDLIKRFAVILQAVSSGESININEFRKYTRETAELYVSLYGWYYMPSSVHTLLIHGADICEHYSFIPIGKLSEEASESRNKEFRKFRESHSRKSSRQETNIDILHNLLISSDPYISFLRPKLIQKKKLDFFSETLQLIILKNDNKDNVENEQEGVI